MVPDGAKCGEEKVIHNRDDKWRLSWCIGLFILPDTDSGIDSDVDAKPDGYIVLYRTCSNFTDSNPYLNSDPQLLLHPFFWDRYQYPDWDPSPYLAM